MKLVTYRITGESPLLLHSPLAMFKKDTGAQTKSQRIPSPEDEAEGAVHRDAAGVLSLPTVAFRSAMLGASKGRKFGKQTAWSVIAASVFMPEEFCQLIDPATDEPLKTYKLDARRVVIQRAGIIRTRARLDAWAVLLPVEVNEEFATADKFLPLLELAGKLIGVGDYRVEKKGWFGRFRAEVESVVAQEAA